MGAWLVIGQSFSALPDGWVRVSADTSGTPGYTGLGTVKGNQQYWKASPPVLVCWNEKRAQFLTPENGSCSQSGGLLEEWSVQSVETQQERSWGNKHLDLHFLSPSDLLPVPSIGWPQLEARGRGSPRWSPSGQPSWAQSRLEKGRGGPG